MINWLHPSEDIAEARRIGQNDRQNEIDDLHAEIEQLAADKEKLTATVEAAKRLILSPGRVSQVWDLVKAKGRFHLDGKIVCASLDDVLAAEAAKGEDDEQ